jgi:hypothetical protein
MRYAIRDKKYGKIYLSIFTLLLIAYCLLLAPLARAQTPSPEPTPTEEEISPEIKEKVQERIEAIKESSSRKAAYYGTLADVSNSTLTLEARKGEVRVKTDEDTEIIGKKGQVIELEDLEIGDFLIALGYLDENELLSAKRITVYVEPPEPAEPRYVAYGKVIDISSEENVISLTNPVQEITYEIEITTKTTITKKVEDKMEEIKFGEIEIGDLVAAVGTREKENGTITATAVHLIPGETEVGEEEEEAEETTPTPKATATPTPEEEVEE